MYIYVYVCRYISIPMCMYMNVYMFIYTHVYIYMYMYNIHTCPYHRDGHGRPDCGFCRDPYHRTFEVSCQKQNTSVL